MERADIAGMSNALREAFLAAGKDIEEKRVATGSAFFTSGHAVGQYETRSSALRARLWLPERERQKLEARPTFDADSGWLHVVSDEDVAFVRSVVGAAHRAAATGNASVGPPAPRPARGAAMSWTVGRALPERGNAEEADADKPAKRRGASRRPSSKI